MSDEMMQHGIFRILRSLLLPLAVAMLLTGTVKAAENDVIVFAAASTTNVVSALGKEFEKRTGFTVIPSFAGSGTLARQISEGAPADIMISANMKWLNYLEEAGFLGPESLVKIASNNLVLVVPEGTQIPDPFEFEKLPSILGQGRLAIGNPAHVPAGNYAKAALQSMNLWDELESQLVLLPNVRAVLALVERGEVPFAIIYETDMRLGKNISLATTFPIDSYPPISYGMAKIKDNDDHSTNLFYDFVLSPDGQEIFRQFGFIADGN
ncbi:MAG: molybdate ABC transporter substrate-binding protein [Sneathiella sp.]|uniref:molybdate ABC transporter substrate-binding protein n=1 Tax=Sneathiella sp. TaxID=1964365 RepID=UPI000C3EC57D|nr:molybdate ABC transporter substrate-binding protein [Sneathiella sp.]MAZ01818.1 molybdate ABC transporter substrate-binding protein [Sneathiella sp.]